MWVLHAVLFLIIYVQVLAAASSVNYYKRLCVCVRACVRVCDCVCVRVREREIIGDSVMSTQQERRIH